MIAASKAYRDTGDAYYLDWLLRTIDYCKEHFTDPEYGEWSRLPAPRRKAHDAAHEGLHVQGPLPRAPRAVHDRTSFDRVDWRLTT